MSMFYPESTEAARGHALLALDFMGRHGVAPNPDNFTVWYAYASRRNADLVAAIDALIRSRTPFTPDRNAELHASFFADREDDELRDASRRLQAAIDQILAYVADAGLDASRSSHRLAGYSNDLRASSDASPLADVVKGVLLECQRLLDRSRSLEHHLKHASGEITELREHLETVRREALTDALTGLANRKLFDAKLHEETRSAEASGEVLCLLMADIDHFKTFNDSYGHRVGDEVLKIVARTLKEGLKGQDTASRYGGEEFAILLPRTGLSGATAVAEQIRSRLARRTITNRKTGESYGSVTVSIGISQYRFGEALDGFLQRADQALYRAKNGGRNRVAADGLARPASIPA
ncbi:MAG: GGDEF domain-containing protein [Alphaproteobacteria bacterium]|nr:MAG: GGDEF domain-containing protein [Alphaproteobacteria bacterium]